MQFNSLHKVKFRLLLINKQNTNWEDFKMTRTEAEKLGWTFKGSDKDTTAEKGRLIHMGPLAFVLKLISMV